MVFTCTLNFAYALPLSTTPLGSSVFGTDQRCWVCAVCLFHLRTAECTTATRNCHLLHAGVGLRSACGEHRISVVVCIGIS